MNLIEKTKIKIINSLIIKIRIKNIQGIMVPKIRISIIKIIEIR